MSIVFWIFHYALSLSTLPAAGRRRQAWPLEPFKLGHDLFDLTFVDL